MVFCFDMLFHIMDDLAFEQIIDNLMKNSSKWLVVCMWDNNPLRAKDDGRYQSFKKLPLEKISNFQLVKHEPIPLNPYGAITSLKENKPLDYPRFSKRSSI